MVMAVAMASEEDHDHDHETHPWEWAGLFTMPAHHDHEEGRRGRRLSEDDHHHLWFSFQANEETGYPDASMLTLFLNISACDEDTLEALEETAEGYFENALNNQSVTHNGEMTTGILYNIEFNGSEYYRTILEFEMECEDEDDCHFAMFSQHFPMEFETTEHFLKDAEGHDVEPCVSWPESEESSVGMTGSTLASTVFLATALTAICSLIGVLTLAPIVGTFVKDNGRLLHGFSAGAILATAFFLLLFEGNHMMYEVGGESDQSAVYGVSVIAGILTGVVVHLMTENLFGLEDGSNVAPADVEMAKVTAGSKKGSTNGGADSDERSFFDFSKTTPVCWSVFWGDLFHNISDGIVVASAFLYCSKSFGWTLVGATVAHEVTQELADWFMLTGKGNATVGQAVLLNVVSSLSAVVSGLIICAIEDEANSSLVGVFLSYGGGVYLYVSLVEIMPLMFKPGDDLAFIAKQLLGFCIGVTALGLVLLNHEHCSIGGEEDGGGGHAH